MSKAPYSTFLKFNPGLDAALEIDHKISRDLVEKLYKYGSLSPAQVSLAFKLHADAYSPARPSETHVAAPEGRQTFRGTVVSIKQHDSQFGLTWKMTIKVATPAGVWLAWGTIPRGLNAGKGDVVELTATLTRGSEAHFAFAKRPSDARVIDAVERAPAPSPRPGVADTLARMQNGESVYPAASAAPEHKNAAALRELAKVEAQGADPVLVAHVRAKLLAA